jgi:polyisoprenoid-binding protein YceI
LDTERESGSLKALKYLVGLAVVAVAGFFAYVYFFGGSGEPSTELTTPSLASTTAVASGTAAAGGSFVIVPEESTASFILSEVLLGEDNVVLGTTNEVAGQVQFDVNDPAAAQFSDIVINARTFVTDTERRDRAIRSPVVLDSASDEFEFITFTPTSIEGLSGPVTVGQELSFTVTGNLLIKGTTQSVVFDVTATLESDDRLAGQAETELLRSDFGIGIPNAPGVANVSEEVTISLDFVATRA